MQERRNKKLYFKCGDKYGPDHTCKDKLVYMVLVKEGEEFQLEDHEVVEGEVIQFKNSKKQKNVEFSIHSLSGKVTYSTMILKGSIQEK